MQQDKVSNQFGEVGVKRFLRAVKHELRTAVGSNMGLVNFFTEVAETSYAKRIYAPVRNDTQLVLDGFGGSANTFAWFKMRAMNPGLKMAHHVHLPATVIEGVKRNLPVAVIIRNPVDAVTSLMVRDYYPGIRQGLRHWILFYERLLPLRDSFEVWTFEDITENMTEAVVRLNKHFGADFCSNPDLSEMREGEDGKVRERGIATDVEVRKKRKKAIQTAVESQEYRRLRERAMAVFQQYIKKAEASE